MQSPTHGASGGDGEWEIDPEEGVPIQKNVTYGDKAKHELNKGTVCMPGIVYDEKKRTKAEEDSGFQLVFFIF